MRIGRLRQRVRAAELKAKPAVADIAAQFGQELGGERTAVLRLTGNETAEEESVTVWFSP